MLSKTKFLIGSQCEKYLWLDVHEPQTQRDASPDEQRIMDQGTEVGKLAREHPRFDGGTLIEGKNNGDRLRRTRELIDRGKRCLFEATFLANEILVKCDVLLKENNNWNLIEVKSSTGVKEEHLPDLAIQLYVLRECGLNVDKTELMLINNEGCVYPDLSNLFKFVDLTDDVSRHRQNVRGAVLRFQRVLRQDTAPDVSIGRQCNTPRQCPFVERCWSHVPEASFDTIPRLHWDKKEDLLSRGILHAKDADVGLTPRQREYVNMQNSGEAVIDRAGLGKLLDTVGYPLYFLDFETINPAIPRHEGMRPYELFPFQYSCHVMESPDAEIQWRDYLCTENRDPRKEFLESLTDAVGNSGSIICYSAYEKRVLRELKKTFPARGAAINVMIKRLWDLEIVFKQHYKHPRFLGRTSLKSVLPALIPDAGYENLTIQGGGDACALWQRMIYTNDPKEKKELDDALREYCRHDTFAMVKLWQFLSEYLQMRCSSRVE